MLQATMSHVHAARWRLQNAFRWNDKAGGLGIHLSVFFSGKIQGPHPDSRGLIHAAAAE